MISAWIPRLRARPIRFGSSTVHTIGGKLFSVAKRTMRRLTIERTAEILHRSVRTIQDYEQGLGGHGVSDWTYRYLVPQTQITKEPRDFSKELNGTSTKASKNPERSALPRNNGGKNKVSSLYSLISTSADEEHPVQLQKSNDKPAIERSSRMIY